MLRLVCSPLENDCAVVNNLVIDPEVNINVVDVQHGFTPLMRLCAFNQSKSFRGCFAALLRRDDIDVSIKDGTGNHALHLLCFANSENVVEDVVRQLINRGCDLNSKEQNGYNVLHCLLGNRPSECQNLVDLCRLFIDSGADAHATINNGDTPLMLLCRNANGDELIDVIKLLVVFYNSSVKATNKIGETALHCLCANSSKFENFLETLHLLVQFGINTEAVTEEGENALLLVCKYSPDTKSLFAVVRFLLDDVVLDPNHNNSQGESALHCLFANPFLTQEFIEVARFLVN